MQIVKKNIKQRNTLSPELRNIFKRRKINFLTRLQFPTFAIKDSIRKK